MDFSAPSFSLGLDFGDPTPEDDPREEATGYVAPDAPSFSLGLDFDCYDDGDEPPVPASGSSSEGPARRYEAPDAPSFSLGLDFDDDDGGTSEPQIPARGPREEQERPRRYEAPDAPSFSLGIDHDDDDVAASEPRHLPFGGCREEPPPPRYKAPDATQGASEDLSWLDDGDELLPAGGQRPDQSRGRALDSDPLLLQPETTRLKRLRRGPAPRSMAPPPSRAPAPVATEASPDISRDAAVGAIGSYEDEIEDFTHEEPPRGMPPSVGSCRTSSNSKFSLLNRSVLMTQSTSKTQTTKSTPLSNSFASKPLEESCTKKLLPKITVSPLRKIYFLDSDTDSDDNKNQRKAKKPVSPIKKRQESMHKYMQKKPILQQSSKSEGSTILQKSKDTMKDSWATPALDEFCSEYLQQSSKSEGSTILQKSKDTMKDSWATGSTILQQSKDTMKDSWATPALDEFCSEYFKSVQDSRPSQQKNVSSISGSKVSRPYSSVSEIGEHFRHESTSSGVVLEENLTDSHPPAMHYFFHHDQRVQELVRERLKHFVPIGAGTTQGNDYSVEENLNYRTQFGQSGAANDQWVTPNRRTSVPTDFGKRRVHAGGTQSGSGHWFTGEDGRKVYVSKNGQELTGRDAYKQYKKESGKGFRNYKKKSTVKKEGSARANRGSSTAKKASSSSTVKRSSTAKRKR